MRLNSISVILFFFLFVFTTAMGCVDSGDGDAPSGSDDQVADDSDNDTGNVASYSGADSVISFRNDDDADDENYPETCENGSVFDFFLDSTPLTVPYPNNIYTVGDPDQHTGLRINVDENATRPIGLAMGKLGFLDEAYNSLGGFSTVADMYIPLSAEPRPDTLPDAEDPGIGDSVFLMVADEGSPFDGEFAPFTSEWQPRSIRLQTWKPLRENTHYVLVATRKLAPREDRCYRASTDMRDIIENRAGASELSGRYEPYIQMLEGRGFDRGQLLAISDFTTLCATCDLNEVRQILDEQAETDPPQWADWQITPNGNAAIDSYATAVLDAPKFQDAGGVWTRDENGDLVAHDTEELSVLLSLPAISEGAAQQPFPIIVFGHGAISRKESLKSLAPYFAERGFAMAGINAVCHGDRIESSDEVAIALCYFNFFEPLHWRDNIRQTASDHLWLVHALKNLGEVDEIPYETGGDGIPDFDTDHVYYIGHSLGTIHGGVFSALESNIDTWVLTMAGANYVWIGFYTYVVQPVVEVISVIESVFPGVRLVDTVKLIGVMLQNILDAGEPANYLMHLVNDPLPGLEDVDRQVLQIGAAFDETLGGFSGAYFNRAGGWPQLEPYVWDTGAGSAQAPCVGSAFYQYDTADHQLPFRSTDQGAASREQMAHFFQTKLDTGVGQIIDSSAGGK